MAQGVPLKRTTCQPARPAATRASTSTRRQQHPNGLTTPPWPPHSNPRHPESRTTTCATHDNQTDTRMTAFGPCPSLGAEGAQRPERKETGWSAHPQPNGNRNRAEMRERPAPPGQAAAPGSASCVDQRKTASLWPCA